jgi:hypothetical protein
MPVCIFGWLQVQLTVIMLTDFAKRKSLPQHLHLRMVRGWRRDHMAALA